MEGWARACPIHSVTGDTGCTTFFRLTEAGWVSLDLNWDAYPTELVEQGVSEAIADELVDA